MHRGRAAADRGPWLAQVRFVEVADEVGVSRPTMYSEFGSKAGLGQALVLAETTAFMTGIIDTLGAHTDDLATAAKAALEYTLVTASQNPLLHGVLTNAGDSDLLLLLASKSGPVLPLAVSVLADWFGQTSRGAGSVAVGADRGAGAIDAVAPDAADPRHPADAGDAGPGHRPGGLGRDGADLRCLAQPAVSRPVAAG